MTDDKEKNAQTAATDEPEADVTDDTAAEETADEEQEEEIFVEDPQFNVDYKGDCAYEVKVSIPPANRHKQAEEMFEELKHDAEVPGFRRGKVPRRLIERKFSKAVKGEVDSKLVNAAFQKLVKDQDLLPIAAPDIEGLEDEKDRPETEPLEFTLKFEVAPRVELGKYRGVEVKRPVVTVEDSDIDESVEGLRGRFAVYETVSDSPAQDGDQVIIDFKGTVDGEEFPGGAAEGYPYILGTQRFFAEFEAAMKGASAGQEVETDVTFPADYPAENLRDKTAHFTIKINEVKRRRAPEVTDEFAKQAGYESVDDMRAKIRERMQLGATQQSDRMAESAALEAVIAGSSFEIPKTLLDATAEDVFQNEVRQLLQMRVPMAEVRQREEEMREHAREHALHDIQSLVVLNEIAEAEGIEVSDEDFEQEVANLATEAGVESEAAVRYIEETGRRNSYEARILRAKAMKVVMENAQVTDVELPKEEQGKDAPADENKE